MKCLVKKCKNYPGTVEVKNRGISFHRLPINENLKKKWLKAIGRENFNGSKNSVVCSNHFDLRLFIELGNKRILVPNAVPYEIIEIPTKFNHLNGDSGFFDDHLDQEQLQNCIQPEQSNFVYQNSSVSTVELEEEQDLQSYKNHGFCTLHQTKGKSSQLSKMWQIVIGLGIFLKYVYCSCPIMQQYAAAQNQYAQIQQLQNSLISAGDVTGFEDPGNVLFLANALPDEVIQSYNYSTTLVLAEQSSQNLNPLLSSIVGLKLQQFCVPHNKRCSPSVKCNKSDIYRSANGECNNLVNPKWGADFTPFNRIGDAVYNDGIYDVRQSVVSGPLPSVREIGNIVIQKSANPPNKTGTINFHWLTLGELLVIDMNQRQMIQPQNGGLGYRCCTEDSKVPQTTYYGCDPILLPENDPIASQFNRTCVPYIRTQTTLANDCSLKAAQPADKVTHFMDLSNVYGSNSTVMNSLRTFKNGHLQITNGILPQAESCDFNLFNCYHSGGGIACIGTPTQSLIHSVFFRLHNNIADQLNYLNPHWNDEKIFNESRRLAIGLYQHLVYDEWLPLLLGNDYLFEQGVLCDADKLFCNAYEETVNPSVLTEYTSGALPQFHSNLPNNISFYDENYNVTTSFDIVSYIIGPLILETNYTEALRALMMTPLSYGKFNDLLRNNLLAGTTTPNNGLDLLSNDIYRGRDQGHSPYYYYKNLATPNAPVLSWKDLEGTISDYHIILLKSVYQSVFDLDLYVGLLLEIRKGNDYCGPVGKYLLVEQFKRSAFGDRFFYSFENGPNPFTAAQMTEIRKYTFGQHYCNNVNISQALPSTLELPSETNKFTDCSEFPKLDLSAWKEGY